jgi:UDP-N-acetylglucosamine 4,6-dehydratase
LDILGLLGRQKELFLDDICYHERELTNVIKKSRFLIIGGAGSIGQAVTKEVFKRNPKLLHVIDLSENNLVELVRQLRSTVGYIDGEFRTFAIDCGSEEYSALIEATKYYDFVINLSAMKHVRSEKDPFSLMRMIRVNILNTLSTLQLAKNHNVSKYFCVSTDKAANPVNMMGASKRIMEMFLARESSDIKISTARFANVAFSDGSLLHGFKNRLLNLQPIAAPYDVKRYFITPKESGELCLSSIILGCNMETFFPKPSDNFNLMKFSDIAIRFLRSKGYEEFICESEDEARARIKELLPQKKWPIFLFGSDTTGEKDFEEFFTETEEIDFSRFSSLGVIKNTSQFDSSVLSNFEHIIKSYIIEGSYDRSKLIRLFNETLKNFNHKETGKFLDDRM